MIDLLLRGLLHLRTGVGQLGGQPLALIERLGAYLASMVDAHQPGGVAALELIQRLVTGSTGGRRPRGLGGMRHQGAQHGIELVDQLIAACQLAKHGGFLDR